MAQYMTKQELIQYNAEKRRRIYQAFKETEKHCKYIIETEEKYIFKTNYGYTFTLDKKYAMQYKFVDVLFIEQTVNMMNNKFIQEISKRANEEQDTCKYRYRIPDEIDINDFWFWETNSGLWEKYYDKIFNIMDKYPIVIIEQTKDNFKLRAGYGVGWTVNVNCLARIATIEELELFEKQVQILQQQVFIDVLTKGEKV